MDHSGMDHSAMGHGMDHSAMNHSAMDHSAMNHSAMNHSAMGHGMDHSAMDHSAMNHSAMGHGMDHSAMDHSAMGHGMEMDHSSMGHGMGMDHSSMGHGDMPGMSMSFHFGYKGEVVLFDWWEINNIGGLIGSLIGIFVLAMLYEGLKYWREDLMRKAIARQQMRTNAAKENNEENSQLRYMEQILVPPRVNMLSLDHFIQTLLHMLQMIVSYFLMLIFMTYNVWLCIATVLGAGVGYFLFGWRKAVVVDITEHCH